MPEDSKQPGSTLLVVVVHHIVLQVLMACS